MTPILEMRGIVKEFPGVRALDGVDFTLYPGETLALVGENGAGKSTLMKVLSGVYPHGTYQGEIVCEGKVVHFKGTADSERHGVAIIHQELNLFPDLTVLENLFVGRYLHTRFGTIDWAAMEAVAKPILERMGVSFRSDALVRDLSVGDGQMVEIARAMMKNARILILDEPTSALSDREVKRLYAFIAEAKARGTACVYISHKLDEVYQLCDRAVVLRDGKSVGAGQLPALSRDDLITMMVGRPLKDLFPPKPVATVAVPTLVCKNLHAHRRGASRAVVDGVSFSALPGEILGIGGMMGSGRTELLHALFGHDELVSTGDVSIEGRPVPRNSLPAALSHRLGLVTEDRKRTGLHLGLTIRENISMASLPAISRAGLVDAKIEAERTKAYMQRLRIKSPTGEALVANLSGGNQQKVAIAKWSATEPHVLMLDEPTRGVDVGAKYEIYCLLKDMAERGVTVIVVSSEILELVGLCQRVLVMRDGKLAGELAGAQVDPENILRLAVGGS